MKADISPVQEQVSEFNKAADVFTAADTKYREFTPICGKPGQGFTEERRLLRARGIAFLNAAQQAEVLERWATKNARGQNLAASTANKRMAALVAAVPSAPNGKCACGGCKLLEMCEE